MNPNDSSLSSLSLASSSRPSILRGGQKDRFYTYSYLSPVVVACAETLFGSQRATQHRREITLASEILYAAILFLRGEPTLGEEYCGHIYTQSDGQYPSFWRRFGLFSLETILPYVSDRLRETMSRHLRVMENRLDRSRSYPLIRFLVDHALFFSSIAARLHLAWFYLKGSYLSISRRLFHVKPTIMNSNISSPNQPDSSSSWTSSYFWSGLFTGGRALISLWYASRHLGELLRSCYPEWFRSSPSSESEFDQKDLLNDDSSSSLPTRLMDDSLRDLKSTVEDSLQRRTPPARGICSMCLEPRQETTATPCGHLFCWSCITRWVASKPECPSCRASVSLQSLLPVYNWD